MEPAATTDSPPVSIANPSLERGVNIAGDFEVEPRGAWGTPVEAYFFDLAAEAGFDHVRVPIRWSAYTGGAPDFVIDEAFFAEIDWVLDQAERVGLSIIIDVHHFEELDADPMGNRAELLAIWRQVGERYADRPATVVFELHNEPTGAFTDAPEIWNELLADALAVVRESNPERLVIVGPVGFNHPNRLFDLELPDDPNLMATVHSYDPTTFTVQGAVWFDPPPATGEIWHRDQPTLDYVWFDGSWDSEVTRTDDGFRVAFGRQYAAFGVWRIAGATEPLATLTVEADQWFDAIVLCNVNVDVVEARFGAPVTLENGNVAFSADIQHCGSLQTVAVQLIGAELVTPTLVRVDLCPAGQPAPADCERMIVGAAEAHQRQMRLVAQWAADNGVEMYLGEFGVYDHPPVPVDPVSRVAWIRSMREAAEANGVKWAYFELSNEFALYDHAAGVWHTELLEALFE